MTATCHASMLKRNMSIRQQSPATRATSRSLRRIRKKAGKRSSSPQICPGCVFQCHAPFGALKYKHTPVKDACARPATIRMLRQVEAPYPAPEGALRLMHPDKTDYKFVHGPAATGDCTSCHNPHESNTGRLLVKDGADLCFMCHVDMQKEIKRSSRTCAGRRLHLVPYPHGSSAKKFLPRRAPVSAINAIPDRGKAQRGKELPSAYSIGEGLRGLSCAPRERCPKLLPKTGRTSASTAIGFHQKSQTVLHGPIKDGSAPPATTRMERRTSGSWSNPIRRNFMCPTAMLNFSFASAAITGTCSNFRQPPMPRTSGTSTRTSTIFMSTERTTAKAAGLPCGARRREPKLIAESVPFANGTSP